MDDQRPADIPSKLRRLVHLNVAYRVLICPQKECCKAVQSGALEEHLRFQHDTLLCDRKRMREYINRLGWDYDHSTIELPEDGSAPQQLIPVVDGFQCRLCPSETSSRPFTSINQKRMRVHACEAHKKHRAKGDKLFRRVRLQSWFQDRRQRYWVVDERKKWDHGRRQRYWVVDEHKKWDGHDQNVGIGEEEDSPRRLKEGEDVADINTDRVDNVVVIEARDEEAAKAVVNGKVVEVIIIDNENGLVEPVNIDSDEEVFSDFEDSGDEDYRESSADVGGGDDEGGLSEVEVDGSDDDDYKESSGEAEDGEDEGSSVVEVDTSDGEDRSSQCMDDDNKEVVDVIAARPVRTRDRKSSAGRRVQKRRIRSGFEGGRIMDSDGSRYQNSSPGYRDLRGRQRSVKRQKRMTTRFEDSGVVMPSSQDDNMARPSSQGNNTVPPSSPPDLGWMIERRPTDVDDRSSLPGTPSTIIADDDHDGNREIAPFEPQIEGQCRGIAQSRLEQLRQRLDKWCRTCPPCVLAGDFGRQTHGMAHCWRERTRKIIDQTIIMQEHIYGKVQGEGVCLWCWVPRAICQRWQVKANNRWEEKVPEQQCQYRWWMLVAAVITMIEYGSPEGRAVVGSWMDGDGVTRARPVEEFEWFCQAIWWEEMEVQVAQIVRVFHMLVNKNSRVGKA